MPLDTLLMERFKVKTRAVENPTGITASGAAAQLILHNNPNRLGFIVINLGDNPCFAGLENDVSAAKGIRLDANGGDMGAIWDEDFQMTGWGWWIISPDGPSNIYVLEVVEG